MTDIEKIRLISGDNSVPYVFTNEQMQCFLDESGTVNLASAMALEAWAALYTATPTQEHIGDYNYGHKTVENMLALAERLRKKDAEAPVSDWAEFDFINYGEGI